MSLDWENERYVRVYTRDSTNWKLLDWRARTLLLHLFRKVDRSGVLDVGEDGVEGLAAVVELPLEEVVEPGIAQLLKRGTVERSAGAYLIPNFIEAQESRASDAQRQRVARERRRDNKRNRDHSVTNRDESVTTGHATSQEVTPIRAVPSRSEPSHPVSLPPLACDPPPPRSPAAGWAVPLLEHVVRRMDDARARIDPSARPIGAWVNLGDADRKKLLDKLRGLDESERRGTVDHCLDVLIRLAEVETNVGLLRVGMLAGDASWPRWCASTPAAIAAEAGAGKPRAPPRAAAGHRYTAADELAALGRNPDAFKPGA